MDNKVAEKSISGVWWIGKIQDQYNLKCQPVRTWGILIPLEPIDKAYIIHKVTLMTLCWNGRCLRV